jgi:sulfotransferase
MKTIHYVTSLPRSCSTLLCNVLAQNPKFHATSSSGLIDLIYPARQNLTEAGEFKAMDPADAENMFCDWARGGITNAFNSLTDRPVGFDKGRSWIGYLDLLFHLFPEAKVIVTLRDIRGILTSFEQKRREHPAYFQGEENPPTNFTTIDRRVQAWLAGPKLGIVIERLHEAVQRFKHKLHFVHAEELTSNPKQVMKKLYSYLGEEYYEHDFNNIVQYTSEHDGVWWPLGDHEIRKEIKPLTPKWNDVLGKDLANVIREKFSWINDL